MVYLSSLEGFLWFRIKTFYSREPIYYSCQKKVNNCNEVNDNEQHCYWLVRPSLSSKTWHTYVLPWSYNVPDTLNITGLIAETTLKFINNSRYKIFGYKVFKGTLSGLTQYLFGDWKSLLMKNVFYFTSEALFIFKIFELLLTFWSCKKRLDERDQVDFQNLWCTSLVNKQMQYTYWPISQEVRATRPWNFSVKAI